RRSEDARLQRHPPGRRVLLPALAEGLAARPEDPFPRHERGLLRRRGVTAPDLLDRELLVVTGKGGVGKTTVATPLALAAARRGRRVIVAEVAARDDVSRVLGEEAEPFAERELPGGVHHISIDPEQALAEYMRDQLPGALASLLIASRSMGLLAAATPGL